MPLLGRARPDYAALLSTLEALPTAMQEARAEQRITTGALARQVGVSSTSLSKLGPTSTVQTASRCLQWLANQRGA